MRKNIFFKIGNLYVDGFKNLPGWGRNVWIVILIKLFIIMVVLKIFLMPDLLKKKFDSDEERSKYILEQLTQ